MATRTTIGDDTPGSAHRSASSGRGEGCAPPEPLLPVMPWAPAPLRWLGTLIDWVIVLIGVTMATLVFSNVVVHNVFRGDIAWTTEFSELLMVWVTFLAGAAATRRGAHMVVGEFLGRLSVARRRAADAAIQTVVLVTLALLVWYGVGIAYAARANELTVLGWPMATQYAALPIASALTMVFVAWDLVQILQRRSAAERYGSGSGH